MRQGQTRATSKRAAGTPSRACATRQPHPGADAPADLLGPQLASRHFPPSYIVWTTFTVQRGVLTRTGVRLESH